MEALSLVHTHAIPTTMKPDHATAAALTLATLVATCPRPAEAEVIQSGGAGGGIVQVQRGNGFGCPSPNTWMMKSGIAVCTAPPPPAPAPAPAPVPPPPPPAPTGPLAGKTMYVAVNMKNGVHSPYISLSGNGTGISATYVNGQSCTLVTGQTCEFNVAACYGPGGGEGFVQSVYGLIDNPYGGSWSEAGCESAFVRLQADGTIVAGYARLPSSFEQTRQGAWLGAASGAINTGGVSNGMVWVVPNYAQFVF